MQYNVPNDVTTTASNGVYCVTKALNLCTFRATFFTNATTGITPTLNYNPTTNSNVLLVNVSGSIPTNSHRSFLSVFEIKNKSFSLDVATYQKIAMSGTSTCVKKSLPNGIERIAFVNATPGYNISIYGVITNADYGVIDFMGSQKIPVNASLGSHTQFNGWSSYIGNLNLNSSSTQKSFCGNGITGILGTEISSGTVADFKSDNVLTISNGFWAKPGSTVSMTIGTCTQPIAKLMSHDIAANDNPVENVIDDSTLSGSNKQYYILSLSQNIPNPFNPETKIQYSVPTIKDDAQQNVRLDIFAMNGKLLKTFVNKSQMPGNYSVTWNGRESSGKLVSSGFYIGRLTVQNRVLSIKMLMIR